MVGKRKTEYYIKKYGEEIGKQNYLNMVKRREDKETRLKNGRFIKLTGNNEKDIANGDAIKCEGCGLVASNLQSSHFKSKCKIKSIEEYKKLYPDAPLKSQNLINLSKLTFENFILKYGDEEGQKRWKSYCDKQAEVNSFEYKAKKFGFTKEDFDNFNFSRAVTFDNLINRHGIENGTEIWKSYCEKQRYTNTLEYYVEKYGKEFGKEKWQEYNKEKGKSQNPEWIMEKYNVSFDDALKILSERKMTNDGFSSNTEKLFVDDLFKNLGYDLQYSYKTRQYCLWNNIDKKPNFYDVCCREKMKIIEYCGDYWHANPFMYQPDFLFKQRNKTAKNIWEEDYNKIMTAEKYGFKIKIIWESEYFKNGIQESIKFLMDDD
jgi:hypothetical protein